MKWDRAVHHVENAAQECARVATLAPSFAPLQVTQLWAVGDVLGPPRDLELVTVALGADLPPADVAWWTEPPGAEHWTNMTQLAKNPVRRWWRSIHAPVWNHRIIGPVLVWNAVEGIREEALAGLGEGLGASLGLPTPTTEELAVRMRDELALSLAALRLGTADYEARRWGRGTLEPTADALWRATDGYLDVLSAQPLA